MLREEYASYTYSSYVIVLIVLLGLTLWIVFDEKRQQKKLDDFMAQKKQAQKSAENKD